MVIHAHEQGPSGAIAYDTPGGWGTGSPAAPPHQGQEGHPLPRPPGRKIKQISRDDDIPNSKSGGPQTHGSVLRFRLCATDAAEGAKVYIAEKKLSKNLLRDVGK